MPLRRGFQITGDVGRAPTGVCVFYRSPSQASVRGSRNANSATRAFRPCVRSAEFIMQSLSSAYTKIKSLCTPQVNGLRLGVSGTSRNRRRSHLRPRPYTSPIPLIGHSHLGHAGHLDRGRAGRPRHNRFCINRHGISRARPAAMTAGAVFRPWLGDSENLRQPGCVPPIARQVAKSVTVDRFAAHPAEV